MADQLRAGIIGAGFIGAIHAHAVRAAGGVVARVAASTPERSAAAADRLGALAPAGTGEDLIDADDIDVVHICTPNSLHAPLAHRTLAAARAVIDYSAHARAPKAKPSASPRQARATLEKIIASASGRKTLSEVEAKAMLEAYGIAAPNEALVRSEGEAVKAAKKIGFPVVAKLVAPALAHKSDIGAVVLGLESAQDVRAAYKRLTGPVAKRARVKLDGVLIAEQVSDGIELVLGMHRDPEMGPVILFGAGGVELELTRDVALAAPPLDERAAKTLIASTRVSRLIRGYRGKPALDMGALTSALIGLSQLVIDAGPRIDSIDVNPFLLKRRSGFALDALMILT